MDFFLEIKVPKVFCPKP